MTTRDSSTTDVTAPALAATSVFVEAPFSASWKRRFLVVAALALVLKLYLAWFSPGTPDIGAFKNLSDILLSRGGLGVYHASLPLDKAFNYLPFMLHFVRTVRFLADVSGLPFAFCLRLASVVADVGSALVLLKIVEARATRDKRRTSPAAFALYLGAPVTIWVSGFHGNTDAIMMFLLLISLWLLQTQKSAWLVGVAFGMSLNIKLMPLALAPLFLVFLPNWRQRIEYSIAVVATIFCAGLPYFAQDPIYIWHRAFGYNGMYGIWGIARLLRALPSMTVLDLIFLRFGRFFLLGALLLSTLWMNRLKHRPDLMQQCAISILIILILTPGFGVQYLVWLAPLIVFLDLPATAIFNLASSLFLSISYILIWIAYPIHAWPPPPLVQAIVLLGIVCWLILVLILMIEARRLARESS